MISMYKLPHEVKEKSWVRNVRYIEVGRKNAISNPNFIFLVFLSFKAAISVVILDIDYFSLIVFHLRASEFITNI